MKKKTIEELSQQYPHLKHQRTIDDRLLNQVFRTNASSSASTNNTSSNNYMNSMTHQNIRNNGERTNSYHNHNGGYSNSRMGNYDSGQWNNMEETGELYTK